MKQKIFNFLALFSLIVFTSCFWDDSPTAPVRAPRNTFTDYQHIGGLVNGVWTKEHNPYIITNDVHVADGDTLEIQSGVKIVADRSIYIDLGVLKIIGSNSEPVRFVHRSAVMGGGIFCYHGFTEIRYSIFEGNGKSVVLNKNSFIDHSVFSGVLLEIADFGSSRYDSLVIKNSVFAGLWPANSSYGGVQFTTFSIGDVTVLDSAFTSIRNNVYFHGIGDSTWDKSQYFIVDARIRNSDGIQRVQGYQWPGNGNIFADPKWAKYSYIGPSPEGISENDYHLLPSSPAIGAASDGTNIGVY